MGLRKKVFKNYSELVGIFAVTILACSISATFGVSTLLIQGLIRPYGYAYSWYTWWSGDAVGAMIMLPVFLEIYFLKKEKLSLDISAKKVFQAILFTFFCLGATYQIFTYDYNQVFCWMLCPLLIMSAFLLGKFLSRVSFLILASFIVYLSMSGKTPFELGDVNLNLIYLQCLLFSYAASILFARPLETRFRTGGTYILANLVGWASIFLAIYTFSATERQNIKERLNSVTNSAISALGRADYHYELLLNGGKALLQIKPRVTQEEWRAYVNSLELEKNYDAIHGLGIIFYLEKDHESSFLKDLKSLGIENFKIKELRPDYSEEFSNRFVITMVEPAETNYRARGLDIGSEKNRREAAEKSRALNQTIATAPIQLVQDNINRNAFLLLHPVWDQNQKFIGWTYAPIVTSTFFSKALTPYQGQLYTKIYLGDDLIYQEKNQDNFLYKEKFSSRRDVEIFGLKHTVVFYPTSEFLHYHASMSVPLALLMILFMLFISGFIMEQITFGQRAEELVVKRTQELEKSKMQLIHSSKMASLGEMASSMAHEINNPLTIIIGKIKIIKMILEEIKIDNPALNQEIGRIEITTHRISKIIRGLKTFSRSAQNDPFEIAPLPDMVRDTLDLCSERIKAQGITLTVETIPDVSLFCRPGQISQVILNLLNNAADAVEGQKTKQVSMTFKSIGKRLQILVTDSGTRISEDIAKRIMEPFFTTKTVGKGTGLGLSISKSIIEEHGGTLRLDEHAPNTQFVIELPLAQNQKMDTL